MFTSILFARRLLNGMQHAERRRRGKGRLGALPFHIIELSKEPMLSLNGSTSGGCRVKAEESWQS